MDGTIKVEFSIPEEWFERYGEGFKDKEEFAKWASRYCEAQAEEDQPVFFETILDMKNEMMEDDSVVALPERIELIIDSILGKEVTVEEAE